MIKKFVLSIFIAVVLFYSSSCSTLVPHNQTLSINTSSPRANIWVNGNYEGLSPLQVNVRRNNTVGIMVKKDGYEPAMRTISYHLSTTGILDAIGACIFLAPAVGLVTPGAWNLDETNIHINLLESDEPQSAIIPTD